MPRRGAAWLTALLVFAAAAAPWAAAQRMTAAEQRAVDVAARHPAFAAGLARNPGWVATAYGAGGRYDVYRVDFGSASGAELGWAQVGLDSGRVYAWETYFEVEGDYYAEVEAVLLERLRGDPELTALIGDVDDNDWTWVGYESWRDTWAVHLERGLDSVVVYLRPETPFVDSLERLRVVQVYFPAVVPVAEWLGVREAEAVAVAFADARVAGAVRGLEGWTASAEPLTERVWRVRFMWEGGVMVEAGVDLVGGVVEAVE